MMTLEVPLRSEGTVGSKRPSRKVRRVSISKKRQMTIPKEFYDSLGMGDEAIVEFVGNALIVKPVKEDYGDFSSEILADLIREGYSGEKLLQEFNARKAQIRPAVESMLKDAERNAEYVASVDELFEDGGENP
jgi:bifunctional DNA-binding transcriptional regulator/antitoxin component of YhaV-PrlF toxin-antitoxin module